MRSTAGIDLPLRRVLLHFSTGDINALRIPSNRHATGNSIDAIRAASNMYALSTSDIDALRSTNVTQNQGNFPGRP